MNKLCFFLKNKKRVIANKNTKKKKNVKPYISSLRKQKRNYSYKNFFFGVILILILILLFYALSYLYKLDILKVHNIDIIGVDEASEVTLKEKLFKEVNKPLWLVDINSLRTIIKKEIINATVIDIRRIYPDRLYIVLSLEPSYLLSNINGFYVLDTEGRILTTLGTRQALLTKEEIDIVKGFPDFNSTYVQTKLLEDVYPDAYKITDISACYNSTDFGYDYIYRFTYRV